jgi:hypothetical protein
MISSTLRSRLASGLSMITQFVGKKIAGQAVRDRFAGGFTIAAAFFPLARRRAYNAHASFKVPD